MGENSKIGWTDHTFNPWIGCTKVSEGCKHCYAERDWDKRRHVAHWGPVGTRVVTSEANWNKPLRWNRMAQESRTRLKVFCASLADVFEDWPGQVQHHGGPKLWLMNQNNGHEFSWGAGHVLDDPQSGRPLHLSDVRHRLFRLIDSTPHLDWLLVTKRPENIRRFWVESNVTPFDPEEELLTHRKNVWLLTSVENQEAADKRIPELLKCRDLAPVLGISAEPLLGPVDLRGSHDQLISWTCGHKGPLAFVGDFFPERRGDPEDNDSPGWNTCCGTCGCETLEWPVDWVIAGGESGPDTGPGARRDMDLAWMESLYAQCQSAGVPFFCKQDSARTDGQQGRIPDHIWNTKQFPNAVPGS